MPSPRHSQLSALRHHCKAVWRFNVVTPIDARRANIPFEAARHDDIGPFDRYRRAERVPDKILAKAMPFAAAAVIDTNTPKLAQSLLGSRASVPYLLWSPTTSKTKEASQTPSLICSDKR
ncbi:hypothetical protein FANTH_2190 [Fusarium anthophilum]|uniref:Uncharacterized protein n=1 Tax=Fusarium anthophilum TaxID=48485 RepID=A0A8H4ZU93_9HYPO|nr:hypothetical protein FANTH_2190 [Fusarium anthophilum]